MSEVKETDKQQKSATGCGSKCPICHGDYATAEFAFRLGHRPDVAFAKLAKCQVDKMSGLDELIYAVIYKDDGPTGICGQACSITNPWTRLYLFSNYKAVKDFADKIRHSVGRKNSRIDYLFRPQPDADEIFIIDD